MNKSSIWMCVVAAHVIVLVAIVFQGCGKTTKPLKVDAPPTIMPQSGGGVHTNTPAPVRTTSALPAVNRLPEPVAKPVAVKTVTHTVASGESLETIARKYAVRASELSELNKISDPKKLRVGQKLVIPRGGEDAVGGSGGGTGGKPEVKRVVEAAPVTGTAAGEGGVHVVKSGDSLSKIAVQYGTTRAAIRKANKLKSDMIRVGQKLVIPGKSKEPVEEPAAVVKPVPTASAVPSGKSGSATIAPAVVSTSVVKPVAVSPVVATNATVKANTHRETAKEAPVKKLAVGTASPAKVTSSPVQTDLQVMTLHDVQANEDLAGVAMTYGVKADEIRKLNGLGQEPIRPGQRLKIPVPSSPAQ